MKGKLINKYKKEDNKFQASSRIITSFYSSLIAGLFVGTSFIFVSNFIPFGQTGWGLSWFWLSICTGVYCVIYYFVGCKIIKRINKKEVKGYKNNFLASLVGAIYISIILLFKLKFFPVLVVTGVLTIVSFWIFHRIANKKYRRKITSAIFY